MFETAPSKGHDGNSWPSTTQPTSYETLQIDEPSTHPPSTRGHFSNKRVGLGTITLLFACIFFPLIAFSVVILSIIFHHRVRPNSTPLLLDTPGTQREYDDDYYLVNYSATRILFIASWSSTVAPLSVGAIMTLSLFPISRRLFQISLGNRLQRLPTPYQLALLLGLSQASRLSWFSYMRYLCRPRRASQSPGLRMSAIIYTLAALLSLLIVIDDTVLHITTETVSISQATVIASPNATFSKILNNDCSNYTLEVVNTTTNATWYFPCTIYEAVDSEGILYANETFLTINNLSPQNSVMQVLTGNETTGNLFVLGPANTQTSSNSDYKATTVGVATTCEPISTLCGVYAYAGASTPFNCSSGFSGNLVAPYYDSPALIAAAGNYTSLNNNFGLGVFTDHNLTQAYEIISYDQDVVHHTNNPFYLGVGALSTSAEYGNLAEDPEIIASMHGGGAFTLRCEVFTYDVTYSYINGTIPPSSVSAVVNNGTVGWNFLGPMTFQQERLAQLIDLASVQNTSTQLATSFGNSFSQTALGLAAGVYDSRPVLEQQVRKDLLVAKVLKSAMWLLVLFNLIFALGGAGVAVWAFLAAMTRMGDAHALFSVEEVVGMCFEGEKFGGRGDVEVRFEEQRNGEISGRVGVARREDGWALHRVNVHS